ncbi:MAG: DoxX family membrane protein [Anaerolineaceae bacterium]|jgi:thiosulfate dehydrogenase [quinone] large subunit
MSSLSGNKSFSMTDPPVAVALFNNPKWAWIWLLARLYIGYTWLSAGIEKLSSPAWTQTGAALQGYWTHAVAVPQAPATPPITFDWYRAFIQWLLNIQAYTWFSKLVVAGELLIGVALVLGVFVGISAFFGAFLNWNYLMAGTTSINPLMLVITIALILAWKTAGWWGLDRWLLPLLGAPWKPGKLFEKDKQTA